MDILAIYCYWKSNWKSAHWMFANYLTRVDARRRGRSECLLYLTLVWFDASKRVDAYRRVLTRWVWTGLNPCIALLFLRTRVALGGKKSPTSLIRRSTKLFRFQLHPGVFDHDEFKESAPTDCDNDQHPEIAIWPPKPEVLIYIYIYIWNYDRELEIQRQFWGFRPCRISTLSIIVPEAFPV